MPSSPFARAAAALGIGEPDAADPDDRWIENNRRTRRANEHPDRPLTRSRPAPHPLAAGDGLTDIERLEEFAAAARLDAAHARNEALPEDEQAPWISPPTEQGYRDRRAARKRQRDARRTARQARR